MRAYDNAVRVIDSRSSSGSTRSPPSSSGRSANDGSSSRSNYFYGSLYIVVTVFAPDLALPRFPDDYPLWRNTLLVGTLLGLIGFATFPLMPPRLLPTMGPATRASTTSTRW